MACFMEYEGMIMVDYFTFGVSREISMEVGSTANQKQSLPTFTEFRTYGFFDSATIYKFKECLNGGSAKQVKLHVVKTSEDGFETIVTYTLENCLPVKYNIVIRGHNRCRPPEKLFLSYTSIMVSAGVYGASNEKTTMIRCGYDLTSAKKI